jgi:hypothetical protein
MPKLLRAIAANSLLTQQHTRAMSTISITYPLIWQIDFATEYQWTKCGKCFNVLRNKEIKKVSQGGSIGYNIKGKFNSLTKLKSHLVKIKNITLPF